MANEKGDFLCVNHIVSCTQQGDVPIFVNTLGRVSLASDTLLVKMACFNCRSESFCLGLQNKMVVNFIKEKILGKNR